ncbi:hypothetical protein [Marinigracilibium pacificum]|uniref:Uncharacterized protein n=1 Tax=Marinigracilibium pacificum TaxID=2729599 RepID=A0A848J557_9BACT|nr:hypothetical protein [Marinigracilibium pacificum]NMM50921.1 hypothetical protein [Marinigracilibium pacificum]
MKPETPLIYIHNDHWIDIIDKSSFSNLSYGYASELIQEEDNGTWYSSDGFAWKLKKRNKKFKDTTFNRFFANLINKRYPVETTWTKIKNYDLSELKKSIIECIKKDDDILTQFIPGDLFISKINEANTFLDLKEIICKYSFEVEDEEAIWEELEKLGLME